MEKAPGVPGAFLFLYFYFIKLRGINMPTIFCVDLVEPERVVGFSTGFGA
jgi:hypothetical protein